MTPKQRIEAVYHGKTPDQVPFMLDLSHWFYHKNRMPWDLSRSYDAPEWELIDYHKAAGVGFYLPNLGSFYGVDYPEDVTASVVKSEDGRSITWRLETPLGVLERTRVWEETTYAWAIRNWGIKTEHDLRILGYALANRCYRPLWDRYRAWVEAVGEIGVVYVGLGYSAMGQLLNYWLGVEGVAYATTDWPDTVRSVVREVNENQLSLVDLVAASPVEFVVMGDNFSSDVQPPHFFEQWSKDYYREAVRRLHAAGKFVAVHIDGKLRGALGMIRDTGADCADAVTPAPMGDLTPEACRVEAGTEFILSGGVPPNLWLPGAGVEAFRDAVLRWLALKRSSPRLIANAGDQVPPYAQEDRIKMMRDLVEEHGTYHCIS
ncbi:MAG: hypothetical protein GXY83_14560 [Rhodopirellula sp.]|mgnify:CR=1 FL=1|nr:hypothetical protein [Rhodopirellula sp.]